MQYALRVRCLDALRAQVASRARASTATRPTPDWPLAKAGAGEAGGTASMPFLPDGLIDSDDDDDVGADVLGGLGGGAADDDDDMRAVNALMERGRNRRRDVAMAEAATMIRDSKTATRLRVRTAAGRGARPTDGQRFVGNMGGGGGGGGGGGSDLDDDSSLVDSDDNDDDDGSYSDLDLGAAGLRSDDDDADVDGVDALRTEPTTTSGDVEVNRAVGGGGVGKPKTGGIVLSDEDF